MFHWPCILLEVSSLGLYLATSKIDLWPALKSLETHLVLGSLLVSAGIIAGYMGIVSGGKGLPVIPWAHPLGTICYPCQCSLRHGEVAETYGRLFLHNFKFSYHPGMHVLKIPSLPAPSMLTWTLHCQSASSTSDSFTFQSRLTFKWRAVFPNGGSTWNGSLTLWLQSENLLNVLSGSTIQG